MPTTSPSLTSSLLLGAATGLRSTFGPLAVALSGPPALRSQPLAALRSPWGRRLAVGAALGELAMDKAPFTPARTSPPVLGGRVLFGGLAAYAGAQRSGGDRVAAVASGAAAAVTTALLGLAWRRWAAPRFGADWQGALIEDAASAGVAALAGRSLR